MVIQKAVDNLKEKPKDEKKAIAGGIAIMVIAALIFTWGFFFLKKIQSGNAEDVGSFVPDEFSISSVREVQDELLKNFNDLNEPRAAREGGGGGQTRHGGPQEK